MNFLSKNMRTISIIFFIVAIIFVVILNNSKEKTEQTIFVFDTVTDISLSGKDADKATNEIIQTLNHTEKVFSKYMPQSTTYIFNHLGDGSMLSIPNEVSDLITRSVEISKQTDGAFDITISKLSDLWQVKTATTPPAEKDILSALDCVGYEKIKLSQNLISKTSAEIDFGGILKGYAADKVRKIAQKNEIESGIVNLGGNVCLIGSNGGKPWNVGIVNPFSPSEVYLTVKAENTNVITSGAYQRYFEYNGEIYHHILSPKTGYPSKSDLASVTVISPDGTLADALSTAIFVQGSRDGLKTAEKFGLDVIMIKKDGSVIATEGVKYKMEK